MPEGPNKPIQPPPQADPQPLPGPWFSETLLSNLKTAVLAMDAGGHVRYCNPAFERLFGLSSETLLGACLSGIFPAIEVEDRLENGLLDVLQSEGSFDGTAVFVSAQGRRFPVILTAFALFDDAGEFTGWLAEVRDFSADEALMLTESITQQFLAAAGDLGRYITEGLPPHTLLDRTLNSLILHLDLLGGAIHLIDPSNTTARLESQRNLKGPFLDSIQNVSLELGFVQKLIQRRKASRLIDLLDSGLTFREMLAEDEYRHTISMPLFYKDSLVGLITLIPRNSFGENELNLLESIGAQLALALGNAFLVRDLRESQRKYSTVVERANDGIMISQDGVFKLVNKQLADMLGYTVTEMIGMEITRTIDPDDLKEILRHYEARIRGTVPREIYAGRMRSKSGKNIQVEFNACTIQYEGKTASLSFVRNIAPRIALQDQVVAQKEMAEFYNDVLTHDINNFCQAMLGNLDELITDQSPGSDPVRAKRLLSCKNSILKISHIIDRIRELMHIQTLDPESLFPQNLADLISEGVEITHESFPHDRFRIRTNIPKDAHILGNNLVILIVINLLSNAIKHNDKADKRIDVTVESAFLHERPAWKLLFADNGPGIAAEIMDKIFERFARFSKRKGKGLGLSIVRALVDKLSGQIQIAEPVNSQGGVTIAVTLPQA